MLVRVFVVIACLLALLFQPCGYQWPDNMTQHKGFIEVNQKSLFFYWLFESRNDPSSDPLVVWLTGGQGCSSELALFGENGPFIITDSAKPVYNKYGLNNFANILCVDQPGFSYGDVPFDYETNKVEIATTMWNFMLEFYTEYPQYSKLDLYIIGENYPGHYVPVIGKAIVGSNSIYAQNLKGIAVGHQQCKVPPLCYDTSGMTKFLSHSDVMGDLGLGNHSWEQCNHLVEMFLLTDWVGEFKDAVSVVLSSGRRVMVYSGKEDYVCNYLRGLEWTNATLWKGTEEFDAAVFKDWHVDGEVAGQVKNYDKLTFVQVEGVGHMIPKDQPKSSIDMLKRFLNNIPFN